MGHLHAFNMGANIVTIVKNEKFRAMTCAWAMMVDYDKILLLLGSESDTGKAISKGDIVGVSALATKQEDIALHFGLHHSDCCPKYKKEYLELLGNSYVIRDAKVKMETIVIDVLHLEGIKADNLLYLKILHAEENEKEKFLSLENIKY